MTVIATRAALVARLTEVNARPLAHDDTSTAYPYTVVHIGGPWVTSQSQADDRTQDAYYFQTTVVGVSQEQCDALLERVLAAFRRWRPVMADRVTWKVDKLGDGQPSRRDDDLPDRVLWIATDQWRFTHVPA